MIFIKISVILYFYLNISYDIFIHLYFVLWKGWAHWCHFVHLSIIR